MNRIITCSVIHDKGNVVVNANGEGSDVIVNGIINKEVKRINEQLACAKKRNNEFTQKRNNILQENLSSISKRILTPSTVTKIINAVIFAVACIAVYTMMIIRGEWWK